jgi:hypothetical protein
MRRASPYPYTMSFGHDVDKTYRSPSAGHRAGRGSSNVPTFRITAGKLAPPRGWMRAAFGY